jgi:hypothetical protein
MRAPFEVIAVSRIYLGGGCLITERLDGRSASTAPRLVPEASVDLTSRRWTLLRRRDQGENLLVAGDDARADNLALPLNKQS